MQRMVRTILECMQQAGASRVTNVQLVLGASGHFTVDAAYQHFEALTKGTPAQDASLTILWLPAQYQCFFCLHRFESSEPSSQVTCPKCGEVALEVGHQDVCFVSAIDVAFQEGEETALPTLITQEEPRIDAHI
ncbi:MAG TPA: hydrogenase maturation nickel metallochaperone HypA, partial [Ktedonobacteraceae bacterium]|nr:hydrogenase maturation nickel metallochaperone HypA [Ktedonobacteraceae bacterium]